MNMSKADQGDLWRTIQNTFLNNPTQEGLNALTALVDSLTLKGALPVTAPDVWREWSKNSIRRVQR
jgi:hypothetical protein